MRDRRRRRLQGRLSGAWATQLGADVRVIMTRSAERFVGVQTFAALTGNPVMTELFSNSADVPHVELARGAQLAISLRLPRIPREASARVRR